MSHLQIKILAGKDSLGRAAADQAATSIRRAIRQQGKSGENFSANRSTWRLSELGRMRTWHSTIRPQTSKSTILIWWSHSTTRAGSSK